MDSETYNCSRYAHGIELLLVVGAGLRAVIGNKDDLFSCDNSHFPFHNYLRDSVPLSATSSIPFFLNFSNTSTVPSNI